MAGFKASAVALDGNSSSVGRSADVIRALQGQFESYQNFIHQWVETVVGALDEHVTAETRSRVLKACGRQCARVHLGPTMENYRGNPDGFMEEVMGGWTESYHIGADNSCMQLCGKRKHKCVCPLLKKDIPFASQSFCSCSEGWAEEVYSIVLDQQMEATVEESVLKGSSRCVFNLKAKP